MSTVVLVVHLMVAIALVALVLMQRSEGGALGIGGGGNSLISGRGAADVLARATGFLALAFFITSISLTVLGGGVKKAGSVLDEPTHTPNFLESILPKKQPDVVAPPTAPAPQFPTTSQGDAVTAPASAPAGDVVPPPADAIQRAGPIDASPLPIKPTPAAKPSTPAPKPVAVVTPTPKPAATTPKPTATAAVTKPAAKPVVGATKPAPASGAESGEPAAPPGRAGPDE